MRISRKQLSLLIERYLLTEAVHDKVASQLGITDPERIEQLRIASEKPHRLQKPELLWIGSYFTSSAGMQSKEKIEDIVASIKSLQQNKAAIIRKGGSINLEDYSTPREIDIAVASARGYAHDTQLSEQANIAYEDDNWVLWVPHTREASCTIGRGTNWCTAIPGAGNNLFYNYVIGERAILFYLVKKNPTENDDPTTTYFSLGTVAGKIPFAKEEGKGDGSIVVDGTNHGLTRQRFESVVGKGLADHLIDIIENYANKNYQHPSSSKIFEMLRNPALYVVEMRGKSVDVKFDLTAVLLNTYKNALFDSRSELTEEDREAIIKAFTDTNDLFHQAVVSSTEIKQKDIDDYKDAIVQKNVLESQKFSKVIYDGDQILDDTSEVKNRTGNNSVNTEFCKRLTELKSQSLSAIFKKVEDLSDETANLWDHTAMSDLGDGYVGYAGDLEITDVLKYVLENETVEIQNLDDSVAGALIEILLAYHADLLFLRGYGLIKDPYYNEGGWHTNDHDADVQTIEEFMNTDREKMMWVDSSHWGYYPGQFFTEGEIRSYLSNNYSQDVIAYLNANVLEFAPA